jgi:hypothetical protein
LASHNFCPQTVLFCTISFQFWHQRSLAGSSTPSCYLNLGCTTVRLPINPTFGAFLGIQSRARSLCTCPAHYSLQFNAGY